MRKGISCYEDQSLANPSRSSGLYRTRMGRKPVCLEWAHPSGEYLRVIFICQPWAMLCLNKPALDFSFFFRRTLQRLSAWKTWSLCPLALCTCFQHSTSNTIVLGMLADQSSARMTATGWDDFVSPAWVQCWHEGEPLSISSEWNWVAEI